MGIKYSVNEKFFDKWDPTMTYILGYLYADGSLENSPYIRGKYVRVTSTDESSIILIKEAMGSEHPIVKLAPYKNRGKDRYFLRIGSHRLYNRLTKLGLYPNKSLTITFPKTPKYFLSHFVRGYFDGDGCVHIERGRGKNGKMILKRLSVIFTSGSEKFLIELARLLHKHANLSLKKIYKGQRAYQLRYSTADSIKLFTFIYKNSKLARLGRKFDTFTEYFSIRPTRADKTVAALVRQK